MVRQRRKWTEEEDNLLREAVNQAQRESRPLLWRELAKSVPGRTNKDCRRRWWNSLSNNVKGPWTESEDERLFHAVQIHGNKWTRIASAVRTRNSDQCASHWTQSLNPEINHSDWTADEDERLLRAVRRFGTNWVKVAAVHSPTRTTLSLKNRYTRLKARLEAKPLQQRPGWRSREQTASSCSDAGSGVAVRASKDEQTDDDDDDEDDDDDSDMDDDNENGELADPRNPYQYWQDDLLVTSTEQWQNLPTTQQPSTFVGAESASQCPAASPAVDQWMTDALASPLYSDLFSFNFNGDAAQQPPADAARNHQQTHAQSGKSNLAAPPHGHIDPDLAVGNVAMASGGFEAISESLAVPGAPMVSPEHGERGSVARGEENLHRVSVHMLCTSDQLGSVLRNLAGLAKSVTVKVES